MCLVVFVYPRALGRVLPLEVGVCLREEGSGGEWEGKYPPPPDTWDTVGYGQKGDTHPTGMHSCVAKMLTIYLMFSYGTSY